MADQNTTTSETHQTSTTNHLGTNIPSGNIDGHDNSTHNEKQEYSEKPAAHPKAAAADDDDEEEEDMDALIDELESQDGGVGEEEEEEVEAGEAPPVPDELLQTDTRVGLTESEVTQRRRKYGLNQMKEEKENLVLKFLGYFVGPIQFVMEVCHLFYLSLSCIRGPMALCSHCDSESSYSPHLPQNAKKKKAKHLNHDEHELKHYYHRLLLSLPPVCRIGSTLVSSALYYCSTLLSVSSKNSRLVLSSTN